MKSWLVKVMVLLMVAAWLPAFAADFLVPGPSLPNLDQRERKSPASEEQKAAYNRLLRILPSTRVEFDLVTGAPRYISSTRFLTGSNGLGKAVIGLNAKQFALDDPNRPLKLFLAEHSALFGHGPEILTGAIVKRQFVGANNGLRTVVWQQQLDGLEIFEGVLTAHTSKQGELVNVSSQFIPDPSTAADYAAVNRASGLANPAISAPQAVILSCRSTGEEVNSQELEAAATPGVSGATNQAQRFTGKAFKGPAETKLVWLAVSKDRLRLCWEVLFTSRSRGEMFRVLIDAGNGQVWLRQCLTAYISDATYRVYTNDSPAPLSPGLSVPSSTQPPRVLPVLITWPALDTNASPNGWIDDGVNETRGNNVDAHTDRNADDMPDLPRPQGSPFRVFDFTPDLSQDPTNYSAASVVQLFYLCNWMHDVLYQFGFTEAAGNFQNNNFGRGGVENDALQADSQDGSGVNNANFSTPPDGSSPRMQMYLFNGPNPGRDGSLDAEVVLHEYTHGLSNRRVGGGVLISALQSTGLGEGWSDFWALSLLSEPGDDLQGNYAFAAYSTYALGGLTQNYYYGIRRYPYSTDLTKNPLTFQDIDPSQARPHGSVPRSPIIGTTANEPHNIGEVWCVTLWEARANLINKHGSLDGNRLMLQLVMDGMNLAPPNPTFLEARDAILQADLVDTGGTNQNDLWAAFARRGMGLTATCPVNSTTLGVHEAYDVPDALAITPLDASVCSGAVRGPFSPASITMALTNVSTNSLTWTTRSPVSWLSFSTTDGTLAPSTQTNLALLVNDSATNLAAGVYPATIRFTNLDSMVVHVRQFYLRVGQPDTYTQLFDSSTNDLAYHILTFVPDGGTSFYSICQEAASAFPVDPAGGTAVALVDDGFAAVTLAGTNTVSLYGQRTNLFFIGSNGYLTFGSGDSNWQESLSAHFSKPRISALFHDLNPAGGGIVSWKQLGDRVAVTYQSVPSYGSTNPSSFQIEMFYNGRLRLTYLAIDCPYSLVGLSSGQGVPLPFVGSCFSTYTACPPSAPQIVSQPIDQVVKPGANVNLSIGVTGTSPLGFQWMKAAMPLIDGTTISGSATATLSISNVVETDSGPYWVLVTNAYGSVVSSNAILAVLTVDHFVWGHIPAPQSANVPFLVTITAQDSNNITTTSFNLPVALSSDPGVVLSPATTGPFVSGSWTGFLAVAQSGPQVTLRADDGFGHSGVTNLTVLDAPSLGAEVFGDILLLFWPAGAPSLRLETTTNMASPSWLNVPAPLQLGDQFVVPVNLTDPSRFFRLHYTP